jgi:DNA-binding beta-propeller fold protein YncE
LVLVSLLVLVGLVLQTWVMARNKAAMTFDLARQGTVIPKGVADGQLMGAAGMGISEDGSLYVLDSVSVDQARLQKFDASNAFVARYRAARPSQDILNPRDLAVGKDGSLAALRGDGGVRLFDKDLRYVGAFETGAPAMAIAIDKQGRILVANSDANKVMVFDRGGKRLAEFGAPGTESGDLSRPMRMRALANGELAVLEIVATGPRIKVFGPDFAVVRSFAASQVGWSDASQMGVTANGFAFFNDHIGDKGIVVYDLNKGKYVGNTKGTTAGDLFVSPGACGGGWGDSIVVGAISGYTRAAYAGKN